jgi:hypothetical protein
MEGWCHVLAWLVKSVNGTAALTGPRILRA